MKAYWHIHHDKLLEFSGNIDKRIEYIKYGKPTEEIELRLRLLKPVKGKLPDAVIKVWAAYEKARAAWEKAWAAWEKAWAACDKARAAYDKARAAYDKAWAVWEKAWAACNETIQKYQSKIEALHTLECPDCPWDGETIFPERKDDPA